MKINSDSFYVNTVAPALIHSEIDKRIDQLRQFDAVRRNTLPAILRTHGYLAGIFKNITGKNKRSLASKYLHFHLPNHFYLYDSRAAREVQAIQPTRGFILDEIRGATSTEQNIWGFGNDVLYRLCQEHPRHDRTEIVIAKIWLIGRSYAAAIERRDPSFDGGIPMELAADIDREYMKFSMRVLALQEEIERQFSKHLSPRELDNLLLNRV